MPILLAVQKRFATRVVHYEDRRMPDNRDNDGRKHGIFPLQLEHESLETRHPA